MPADWVEASVNCDEPHLQGDQVEVGGLKFGIGIYNQFVYVDPSRDVTIVKQTANPVYGSPADDHTSELETIEFLRVVAQKCD